MPRLRRILQPGSVCALAWTCAVTVAGAATPREWIEVLSQDAAGLEVLLRAPEPVRTDAGWTVPGFEGAGEAGLPLYFEQATSLGVPGKRGARVTIRDRSHRELGFAPARLVPEPRSRAAQSEIETSEGSERDVEPVSFAGAYPSEAVLITGTAEVRGRYIVALHFRPLQHRDDGSAEYTTAMRVRIDFEDRPEVRSIATYVEEPLHQALLNASQAATWARVAAPARVARPQAELPGQRLRIRIASRGLLSLSYDALRAAGVPVTDPGFDPRTFRLYFDSWRPLPLFADSTPASWQPDYEMREFALLVQGEADGSFDPGDRVVFFTLGSAEYDDLAGYGNDSLAHSRHPYDRNLYGWLVWGGAFGRRMDPLDAAPTPGGVEPVRTRLWTRAHFEEDQFFEKVDDLWYWQEIRSSRPATANFDLDLGGDANATGNLRLGLGFGRTGTSHTVRVRLNDQELERATWVQTGPLARSFDYPRVPLRMSNTLTLEWDAASTASSALFLKLDVTWERPLVATIAREIAWRGQSGPEVHEVTGLGATPFLLDVSDASAPRLLTGLEAQGAGEATRWRLRHPGGLRHYFGAGAPRDVAARDLTLRNVAPLRARTTSPDMLIVTYEPDAPGLPNLRAAAERLAAHRRTRFPGVADPEILVVSTRDIYENFSGGRMDPLAIRNYAKFLYQLSAEPRLRFLLLFGDATHDPRQLQRGTTATLVPTLQPWYADGRFRQEYAVEDWLGEMQTPRNHTSPDTPTSSSRYAVPDVGIGRIAARSAAEGDRIVDKIVAYETNSGFGTWRSRMLMAADDECNPLSGCGETFHIRNTEDLIARFPSELDVHKFYLTEYPRVLGQKPQGRNAFIRAWSEGCVVLNYQGHGAPRQLSDEVLFLSTDIPSLTNGSRLPIFLPISCTVSEFDQPEQQSMCEDLLSSARGGTIASIGATTPTYVSPNFTFNQLLFQAMFEAGATTHQPIGVIQQLAKLRGPNSAGRFNETYLLLGDPAMSLLLPQRTVRFPAGSDRLVVGRRSRITGAVHVPGDTTAIAGFDGQADVEVFAHADTLGYRTTGPNGIYIPYDLYGPPLYRGTVPVANGRFAFEFIVPVGARTGTKGRVSAYAYTASLDAKGAHNSARVVLGAGEDSSTAAPRIRLSFPNERTRVKAGTLLRGEIRDENGINIQGTSLRNSIFLDFDRRSEPLNVTSLFRYEAGSDSVGAVSVPLPADLTAGPHEATLIASDNLLHTSNASLAFEVVEESSVRLLNVLAFPNPFRDRTHFFFEITDPAEVEVRVFTTAGREVWHRRETFETGLRGSIKWDGVDLLEDTLANGTYVYRLRAIPARPGVAALEHIGKVVIMR